MAINDSLIFICGGYYSGLTYDKSYVYNTNNRKYYPSNSLPFGTNYHSIVLVNNCIYSVGGDNSSVSGADVALIELCNPEFKWAVSVNEIKQSKPYHLIQSNNRLELQKKSEMEIIEKVELYDINAKLLNCFKNSLDKQYTWNANDFNKGIYILFIQTAKGNYLEKWMIN